MQRKESMPSILESEATDEVAEIYADIRQVLGTSIVNLIWRNLATIPGALEWTWFTAKPPYLGRPLAMRRQYDARSTFLRCLFPRRPRHCRIEQRRCSED